VRPPLGLVLSVLTAALWGSLPIALRPVVEKVDPVTVTWTRYLVATAGLGMFLYWQGNLPGRAQLADRRWLFLLLALLGFAGNNFGFLLGLRLTSPSTAQVVIQLAPILVIFGAVRWFGEHFGRWQWVGVGVLPLGMLIFFHRQLAGFSDSFAIGVLVLLGSAFLWAGYALAQKKLLRDMNSISIMWIIYAAGSVLMLPAVAPSHLAALDGTRWWFLFYCCLNSLISYGFFSEALAVWPASRVSAVVATTPLFTVLFTGLAAWLWPAYIVPEPLDPMTLTGAGIVVVGCVLMALRK
jgi:drug/metabolite transporter (DMT)-like permease